MFQYIRGDIVETGVDYIVVENGSIGYLINTSKASLVDIGKDISNRTIYTHLNVREDDLSLYGFTSKEELDMFRLLQTVSKIGPRVGLGVLSTLNTLDIKIAILNEDTAALSKSPGIGKKTAERMILELKDKVHVDQEERSKGKLSLDMESGPSNSSDEVTDALMSLGYSQSEVIGALSRVGISGKSTEELIKLALRELSK